MRTGAAHDSLRVEFGARSYSILIGRGLLRDPATWADIPPATCAAVVTNETVSALYAEAVLSALTPLFRRTLVIALPDGEGHKDWSTLNTIFDRLLDAGCDRKSILIALGGGVVGDLTGFAAACFMRGIGFVQVPTTLLAQVDSSVGGKTGINHPRGKNMIGAFHQPLRVVADTDTLMSLPQRELVAGLAEVIKYGAIADDGFTTWLDTNLERLLKRDDEALRYAIRRSCEIKSGIIERDERESGIREILNFGHTFGHAIEAGLGFGKWLHGEAVGCGMVMAADLSRRLGRIASGDVDRLVSLVHRTGLPISVGSIGCETILDLMRGDKKARGGQIRFVVLESPGHAAVASAPDDMVRDAVSAHIS